jgi:hypothetical protein
MDGIFGSRSGLPVKMARPVVVLEGPKIIQLLPMIPGRKEGKKLGAPEGDDDENEA